MGHNGCLIFCQITADEERRVSRCIVVVQHPSLVFPYFKVSSCAQHPSNALKFPGKTVCLPSDHVVKIHDEQCLSNQKTQPTSSWSLTDSSVLLLVEKTVSPSTVATAPWFQHHIIPISPRVSSPVMMFSRKFSLPFALANSSWFQHSSLSDRQSTNAARILHWREAS